MEKITREEYNKIHDHYKWLWDDGIYRILKNENWATISVPVEIID